MGQQLEELNKQSAALLEKVEAASEACKTAAEASTRAELACSKSPENKDLQVLRDAAAKEEQRTKEMCCFWQERMKQLDTTRAQLAAKLPGNGVLDGSFRQSVLHGMGCEPQPVLCVHASEAGVVPPQLCSCQGLAAAVRVLPFSGIAQEFPSLSRNKPAAARCRTYARMHL